MSESDLLRAIHFRQEFWDEDEAHKAEQAFYDRGGSMMERQRTASADVRRTWLTEQGIWPSPERARWAGPLPSGFHLVEMGGKLAVSELVPTPPHSDRCWWKPDSVNDRANVASLGFEPMKELPDEAPVGHRGLMLRPTAHGASGNLASAPGCSPRKSFALFARLTQALRINGFPRFSMGKLATSSTGRGK